MFLKFKIIPIYIYDGNIPKEKNLEIIKRKNKKIKIQKKITELKHNYIDKKNENILKEIVKQKRKLVYVSDNHILTTKKLTARLEYKKHSLGFDLMKRKEI